MREQTILLVEDEEAMRMVLSDRLRLEGYAVDSATDGESGFAKATSLPFDLMILDVMLPGRNGFDLCRDIRRAGLSTPILFLTALRQPSDTVAGLGAGADGYITKPCDMGELTARVEALLRRAQRPNADRNVHSQQTLFNHARGDARTAKHIESCVSAPNTQLTQDFYQEVERRFRATEGSGLEQVVAQMRKLLKAEQDVPEPPRDKALLGVAQGVIEFLEDAFRRIRSSQKEE